MVSVVVGVVQNGAVVNLSSLSAIQVNPDSAAYNVSKAAQDHLTKTLARKYTKLGVRINSVNPGFVRLPAPAPRTQSAKMLSCLPSLHPPCIAWCCRSDHAEHLIGECKSIPHSCLQDSCHNPVHVLTRRAGLHSGAQRAQRTCVLEVLRCC